LPKVKTRFPRGLSSFVTITITFVLIFFGMAWMAKAIGERRDRIRSEMKFREGQMVNHVTDHASGVVLRVNPDGGGWYDVRFSRAKAYEDVSCREFELVLRVKSDFLEAEKQ